MNPIGDDSFTVLQQELARLQARLARVGELAGVASTGRDKSGAVEVILNSNGLACDVRIAADWRRRTMPDDVGAAVVAADTDAAQNHARSCGEAFASTADSARDQDAFPTSASVAPQSRPRPISDLAESALRAFDRIDRFSTPTPAVTGTSPQQSVRVKVDQGRITDCSIDPSWLTRQDDITLAHAIREALASAAAAQADANRPADELSEHLNNLLVEVKTTLQAISREA